MGTRKTEKDRKIEVLQEEVKALQRQKAFASWLENLGKKKRFFLAFCLSLFLFGFVMAMALLSLSSVREKGIDPVAYELLLSEADGRVWKTNHTYLSALKEMTHGKTDGTAYTKRVGEQLSLTLYGEVNEEILFSYREGFVTAPFGSGFARLSYTESQRKTGRALTLLSGGQKAVLYEAKSI